MSHSLYFLAAALLAAQGTDAHLAPVAEESEPAGIVSSNPGCASCGGSAPIVSDWHWQTSGGFEESHPFLRGGLLSRLGLRLRGLSHTEGGSAAPGFRGGQDDAFEPTPALEPAPALESAPAMESAPRPMPSSMKMEPGMSSGEVSEPPLASGASPQPVTLSAPVSQASGQADAGPQGLPVRQDLADKIGHDENYNQLTGQLYHVTGGGEGRWLLRYSTNPQDRNGGTVVLATAVNMEGFRDGDLVFVSGEILNQGAATTLGAPLYRAEVVDLVERSR